MSTKAIITMAGSAALVLAGVAVFALLRGPKVPQRLAYYAGEIGRYRLWVSTEPEGPSWVEAQDFVGGKIDLADGRSLALPEVRAYVATYPHNVVVDVEPSDVQRYPPLARPQSREGPPVEHRLQLSEALSGRDRVPVSFAPSGARPRDPSYCSTTLTNLLEEPVRVVRFGGYLRVRGEVYEMHNFTDRFFSSDDFQEWYYVPDEDGWLAAGESVTDPNNWGGTDTLWAFEIETTDGERFWTGGLYR